MKKARILLIILCFLGTHASAKEFTKEYTYQAKSIDSKFTAKVNAVENVKSELIQVLAVYLQKTAYNQSNEQGQDFYEKIVTISAGLLKLKIVDETWDGKQYYLKAIIDVDPQQMKNSINDIINRQEEYKKYEQNKKQRDELIAKLNVTETNLADQQNQNDYKEVTKQLFLNEKVNEIDIIYNSNQQLAITKLEQLLRENDNYAYGHYNLGVYYGDNENYTKSNQHLKKAIELNPYDYRYYSTLALYYINQELLEEALPYIDKSIEITDNAEAHYWKYKLYARQDKSEKSMQELERSIEIDPYYTRGLESLGTAYAMKGDFDKALPYFEKTIEKCYYYFPGITNIGKIHLQKKNYTEAIKYFKKANSFHYSKKTAYFIALAYKGLDRIPEAIKVLEKISSPYEYIQEELDELRKNVKPNSNKSNCFTDERDGKQYRYAKINGITWMLDDLAYEPKAQDGYYDYNKNPDFKPKKKQKYFYVHEKNGKKEYSYSFKGATDGIKKESARKQPGKLQGVCPSGWHIPTEYDFCDLISECIGGKEGKEILGHFTDPTYSYMWDTKSGEDVIVEHYREFKSRFYTSAGGFAAFDSNTPRSEACDIVFSKVVSWVNIGRKYDVYMGIIQNNSFSDRKTTQQIRCIKD